MQFFYFIFVLFHLRLSLNQYVFEHFPVVRLLPLLFKLAINYLLRLNREALPSFTRIQFIPALHRFQHGPFDFRLRHLRKHYRIGSQYRLLASGQLGLRRRVHWDLSLSALQRLLIRNERMLTTMIGLQTENRLT